MEEIPIVKIKNSKQFFIDNNYKNIKKIDGNKCS